jgi:hypothetical protein
MLFPVLELMVLKSGGKCVDQDDMVLFLFHPFLAWCIAFGNFCSIIFLGFEKTKLLQWAWLDVVTSFTGLNRLLMLNKGKCLIQELICDLGTLLASVMLILYTIPSFLFHQHCEMRV